MTATSPSPPSPPPAAAGSGPRRWALLLVLAGNMLIDALEVSVVLVALPAIGAGLGLSLWTVQWTMSGFALGFGALLLLGPRITARWGRRPVYLAALLVFAAASAAGYLADSAAVLIATRVVKGVCAALTAPTGLAIITVAFREGPEQRRAVSVYSLFGAAGFTVGLLLSGALTEVDWRWTLLFPAPAALVLLVAGARLIPRDPPRRDRLPAPAPWAPALLRDGTLLRSAAGAAALNGTYLGLLLLSTFELQTEWGWSPWWTALAFLPACLPPALTALHAGRVAGRFGTARLIAAGALAAVTGYGLRLVSPAPDSYATGLLPTLLLVGAAFALSFAPLNMQATSALPPASRGAAVALYQAAVQTGAVVTLCLVAALHGALGDRPALLLVTAIGSLGALVALTGLRGPGGRGPGGWPGKGDALVTSGGPR
ncbi:MFS transporter [Streptomyces nanhaiensis]|uniref:MFS transporter n=1 Tax=Streptomyces nanhaiensis TaxID=679319 RepID=UPI00399C9EEA